MAELTGRTGTDSASLSAWVIVTNVSDPDVDDRRAIIPITMKSDKDEDCCITRAGVEQNEQSLVRPACASWVECK